MDEEKMGEDEKKRRDVTCTHLEDERRDGTGQFLVMRGFENILLCSLSYISYFLELSGIDCVQDECYRESG